METTTDCCRRMEGVDFHYLHPLSAGLFHPKTKYFTWLLRSWNAITRNRIAYSCGPSYWPFHLLMCRMQSFVCKWTGLTPKMITHNSIYHSDWRLTDIIISRNINLAWDKRKTDTINFCQYFCIAGKSCIIIAFCLHFVYCASLVHRMATSLRINFIKTGLILTLGIINKWHLSPYPSARNGTVDFNKLYLQSYAQMHLWKHVKRDVGRHIRERRFVCNYSACLSAEPLPENLWSTVHKIKTFSIGTKETTSWALSRMLLKSRAYSWSKQRE